jgi:hypothetical protein
VSRVAAASGADAPLSQTEVAEMKEHLGFLRRYKEALRLKLNAAEDLLVNGQREPSDRGICHHLLGKVDRGVIERAIEREPLRSDPAARARMLAGALRLTADVGVLLAYLEALAPIRSRAEAAQAFAEAVARIDFEGLSATRLARLLQVLVETFVDHERVQVLFSLLALPGFCRAFDAAASALPVNVAEACAPLRAVHHRLLEDTGAATSPAILVGMEQILAAPDPILRGYAEPIRIGLLELSLAPDVPPALADRAAGVLLASLPRGGRTYAQVAVRRAADLLRRHADDRARAVLEELRRAQPGLGIAERWLTALGARRMGRVALAGEPPALGRLVRGFWLDAQRSVWLRTATAPEAPRLASEAQLQAGLALPGVAAVVEHGVASGIPFVAVSGAGRPLALDAALDADVALTLAAAAARILRALALAGVRLPDAEPGRFLHPTGPPALVLADFDGALRADAHAVEADHARLAVVLARRLVPEGTLARFAPARREALARALDGSADLVGLVEALDAAALVVPRP